MSTADAAGRVVVDPLAPDRDALVQLVGRTHDVVLLRPDPRRVPRPLPALMPRYDVALALAATGGCTGLLASSVTATAGAAAAVAAAVRGVLLGRLRREQHKLVAARPYLVVVASLRGPGRELVERARAAADMIGSSRTCRAGLADPQETAAFLGEEEWGIAGGLRDVAELGEHQADNPGGRLVSVARAERLAAIEARVAGLEEWARQVERSDQALAAVAEQTMRSGPDLDRLKAVRAASVGDDVGRQRASGALPTPPNWPIA